MIQASTLKFLTQIKRPANNGKAWVDEHRAECDASKADVEAFAADLIDHVADFDPAVARAHLTARACVSRLNRDVRFHGGPSFKDYFDVVINPRGVRAPTAYYYLHLEPGKSFAGGGVYNPAGPDLRRLREHISGDHAAWRRLTGRKSFREQFPDGVLAPGRLRKVPRGFDADDPAAADLVLTGFYTRADLSDAELKRAGVARTVARIFKAAAPLVEFLNESLSQARVGSSRGVKPMPPR